MVGQGADAIRREGEKRKGGRKERRKEEKDGWVLDRELHRYPTYFCLGLFPMSNFSTAFILI